MEERIIDKEDPRKIKVTKNAAGGISGATDELAEGAPSEEEELLLDLPEEFEDEDLIGLAPSQLKKELERRKKEAEEALAECERLTAEGEHALSSRDFGRAEPFFAQALLYDPESRRAAEGLWRARTKDLSEPGRLYEREIAEEFARSGEETKRFVREKLGETFAAERAECEAEAGPLREKVRGAQKERRSAFVANRNYYRWRLSVFVGLFCVFCIAMSVVGSFIVRTTQMTPVILTIAFGALALLDLIPIVFFSRKFVVAERLCKENEKLSSTEDGARLFELEERLGILALLLDNEA